MRTVWITGLMPLIAMARFRSSNDVVLPTPTPQRLAAFIIRVAGFGSAPGADRKPINPIFPPNPMAW